jgi:hypothetical protein
MSFGMGNVRMHCVVFGTEAYIVPVVLFPYVALTNLLLHVGASGVSGLLEFFLKDIDTRFDGIGEISGYSGAWSQQFV